VVEGKPGPRNKNRLRRRWFVRFLVGLLAAVALWQVLTPRIVDPQPAGGPETPAGELSEPPAVPVDKAAQAEPSTEAPVIAEKGPPPDPDAPRVTSAEAAATWPELFAPNSVPQSFVEAALRDELRRGVTAAELDRWLKPVPDEDARIVAEERSGIPIVSCRGLFQLRSPWPTDGVLRLEPFATQNLRLLFWNGAQGIAIVAHPHELYGWSANAVERTAGERRPQSVALLTTDQGISRRTANQSVDIHHQNGQLIVSRGGLRLLTVPVDSPPQVVFIECDSSFRAIEMDRRTPLPSTPETDDQAALLKEARGLFDSSKPEAVSEIISRIERLALLSADRGDKDEFSHWSQMLLTIPIESGARIEPFPYRLTAAELIPLADARRSDEIASAWQRLRFWNTPSDPEESWPGDKDKFKRLFDWAAEVCRSASAPAKPESGDLSRPHPWSVNPGRDTPSAASELNAALGDSAWDVACRVIVGTAPPWDGGLVPDARDARLAVTWPQLIRNALRDEPRLKGMMEQTQSRLGELRLNQAVAEGDAEGVRSASVQFLGTPGAARAHLELGDQALALGRFAKALAEFQSGHHDASDESRDVLTQRVRLAASLLGIDCGPAAVASVKLNERMMSADQFEALLVAQRRRAAATPIQPNDVLVHRPTSMPNPGHYGLHPGASWKVSPTPRTAGQVSAQIAVNPAGGLIVTGPLGLCSIAPADNRILWSLPPSPGQATGARCSRPVSAGDRIVVRRPSAAGDELACVEPTAGRVKWQQPRAVLPVISDPLWSQRQLFVVTMESAAQGSRLLLCELDPDTGKPSSQTEVGQLLPGDSAPTFCELAASEERLVIATAGGVLCCDRTGRNNWLQRSLSLPAEIPGDLPVPPVQPALSIPTPTVVVVLQAGAIGIQAFDVDSGRRIWQRAIPDLFQIAGATADLNVALTPRGLLALHTATGELAWQKPLAQPPAYWSVSEKGDVSIGEVEPGESGRKQLVIHTLEATNGSELPQIVLSLPAEPLELVGPIVSSNGRFFVIGCDREHATGQLLELKPMADGAR
jgi:outer membrane protein assembly factor BamB